MGGAPARRRSALALLALIVFGAHLGFGSWLAEGVLGVGLGDGDPRGLKRIAASFTVELRPSEPPQALVPRERPSAARSARPRPAAEAASAAAGPPEAPMPPPDLPAARPEGEPIATGAAPDGDRPREEPAPQPLAERLAEPLPAQAATAAEPAASAPGVPVDWPRSTRLSYTVTGWYRGAVEGQARVDWLREGNRYQVHLEVAIGPSFAPLVSRRMSSSGEIGEAGLVPQRYEEETRVPLREPRRAQVSIDEAVVRLANGQVLPRPPGVQDTASQFVHLTWLFTTRPALLTPGTAVPVMLALPRRMDEWVYDVLGSERLDTGAGPVDAVHVRPRRPARPGGELTAELWVAPSLLYLPVRIVIRQEGENFVDLVLERLPQQTADPATR